MSKRTFVVVAVFAVVLILIGVFSLSGRGEKVMTISGKIKAIDNATRTASLEFVHRKTGQTMSVEGRVPLDCDIRIDGRAATLADLQAGERVEVQGIAHRDRTLSANWVRVSRADPAASQAASGRTTSPASSQAAGSSQPSSKAVAP